jgi:hypothetical protein
MLVLVEDAAQLCVGVSRCGSSAAARDARSRGTRASLADLVSRAQEDRERVLAEFPLEAWPELPLERYALGLDPARRQMTYCRLIEFGIPNLGSIRGGSAAEHIYFTMTPASGGLRTLEGPGSGERLGAVASPVSLSA